MKQLFAVFLVIIMCMSLFCGCSSSKTKDDSWKSKKWDEMNGSERQKTYDYLKDKVEKKWY